MEKLRDAVLVNLPSEAFEITEVSNIFKIQNLTAKESVRSPGHIRVSLQHLRKQRRLLRHEHREIEQSGF